MSWRTVVVTGNAKLDYKMDYLVVRKAEATTRIFIGEIGLLIIESTAVSLTTMLLSELIKLLLPELLRKWQKKKPYMYAVTADRNHRNGWASVRRAENGIRM